MKRLVLLGLLVLMIAASSFATNAPNPTVEPVQTEARSVENQAAPVPAPSSGINSKMMHEISMRMAEEKAYSDRMRELAISGPVEDRIEILRQVNESAEEMHLDLLRIQARYARLDGDEELAQRIDSTIETRIQVKNDPSLRMAPASAEKIAAVRSERRGDAPAASTAKPVTGGNEKGFGEQGGER